jgi:hypothetical protein
MSVNCAESEQKMKSDLNDICRALNITVIPKDFQLKFLCKAVLGINGFLLVRIQKHFEL